ncbi:MAG: metallophosphoesterase family protein [Acidimicrobiales bacterium]
MLAAVVGAVAGLIGLRWTGSTEAELGPGRVELSAELSRSGDTSIELPPLGRVTADTHRTPVALGARVLGVDVGAAQQAATGADPIASLRGDITGDLPGALRAFALHALLVAAATGAVAALLLPGRAWWHAGPGAVGGVLGVAVVLALTWIPYDLEAFREPTFEGELVRAPGLIVAAERNLSDLETIRSRVDTVSDRLAELYAASVGELPGSSSEQVSILHVSDIHLNPLGAELVVELARDLGVAAVLDTGDVTSFGLPVEARFGQLLASTPVPYLLVPGNHDSAVNRAQLAAVPGLTVLDREVVEVEGIRILGVADPTFTASNEVSTEEANETKVATARSVGRLARREDPDVLAVHDARQAEDAVGDVRVVVAGHTHRRDEELRDGTRILTVGSTGATGLGAFTVETSLPYEARVLRFQHGKLVAVDYLTVAGIGGEFTLERQLVPPDDSDEDSEPADDEGDGSAEVPEDQTGLGLGVEERGLRGHPLAAVGGVLDLRHGGRS